MSRFQQKTWKNQGETGSSENNSVLNKDAMNDLESRIANAFEYTNVTAENTNLNDYLETGIYYFDANKIPVNIPAGVNGWLQVIKGNGNFVKQIWYRLGTENVNDFETYVRTKCSSWSNWKKYEIVDDTGWKDLPFKDGFSVGTVMKKAQYRKNGKLVQIRGDVSGITAGSTVFAILPEGFRPSMQTYHIGTCSGHRTARYYLQGNGNFGLEWTNDDTYNLSWYGFNFCYFVD